MRRPLRFLVIAATSLVACKAKEEAKLPLSVASQQQDQQARSAEAALPPEAIATLDSGNVQFRAAKYDAALSYYTAASRLSPTSASPYYGVLMAAQKLGNQSLVDSATKMIKALSGEDAAIHADPAALKAKDPHGKDPHAQPVDPHAIPKAKS